MRSLSHFTLSLIAAFLFSVSTHHVAGQCAVVSPCGYTLNLSFVAHSIVRDGPPCPSGYNYNVLFSYSISAVGTNTCYNGTIGFQPEFICNGQSNGYYTINMAAPTVGAAAATSVISGTLTTHTNPWRGTNDCSNATPWKLNCNALAVTVYGPGISATSFTCGNQVLPVTLQSFDVNCIPGGTEITWRTATEEQNRSFDVQKSEDGIHWVDVERRNGAGTSKTQHDYRVEDRTTGAGLSYYRLAQTDHDGGIHYSFAVMADCSSRNGRSISPNPVRDHFTMQGRNSTLRIFKYTGELAMEASPAGEDIDVSQLPAGIYFIESVRPGEPPLKLVKE